MRYNFFGGGAVLCPRCHGRDFHTVIEGQDEEGRFVATLTCDWCDAGDRAETVDLPKVEGEFDA